MPVISKITGAPFRFWCQKILPAVYDDSLSYYELLCKVVDYLNKVMEDDINVVNLVNELEEFVNNYFNNLDVQQEINNKLDAMAEDGSLIAVIAPHLDPIIAEYEATLDEDLAEYKEEINSNITSFEEDVNEDIADFKTTVLSRVTAQDNDISSFKTTVNNEINEQNDSITVFKNTVNSSISSQDTDIDAMQSQLSNFITAHTSDANTELLDIRVGFDGVEYGSAGNAVREQVKLLNETTVEYKQDESLTLASDDVGSMWRYTNDTYNKATGPGTAYWHIEEYNATELCHYKVTGTSENPNVPVVCFADNSYNILGSSVIPTGGSGTRSVDTVDVIAPIGCTKLLVNMFALEKRTVAILMGAHNSMEDDCNNLSNTFDYFLDTGNKFINVEYEQGDLSLVTGEGTYSTIAIRSKDFIDSGNYTFYTNGQLIYVFKYLQNGTIDGSYIWGGTGTMHLSVPATHKFKIVVNKADHSAITPFENEVELTTDTFISDLRMTIPVREGDFISVCHQGYSATDPLGYDRLSGYPLAAKMGFDYAESDIKLTQDNKLVCCHDASFEDATTHETVVIAEHTLADLKTYDYYGEQIATLDEILEACKVNGIGLCIDHISTSNVDKIVPIVKKYGMQKRVIYIISWMQEYPDLGGILFDYIANIDPTAKFFIIPVGSDPNALTVNFCNSKITNNNTIYMDMAYTANTVETFIACRENLDARCKMGMWTNDSVATCKQYLPYVEAISSNKISSHQLFDE